MVLCLAIVFCGSAFAAPNGKSENALSMVYAYENPRGEDVHVYSATIPGATISKVFVDGELTQEAFYNLHSGVINVSIFDSHAARLNTPPKTTNTSGVPTIISYLPSAKEAEPQLAADSAAPRYDYDYLFDEPVDNAGLSSSGYGDGYYYIGEATVSHLPGYTGMLTRKYTSVYNGLTKHWQWKLGDTAAAIVALVSAVSTGLVAVVLSLIVFAAEETVAYNQAMNLETFTHNYKYRVRVSGAISYEPVRGVQYWKIDNTTEHTVAWEKKKQVSGSYETGAEMVTHGIENYVQSHG